MLLGAFFQYKWEQPYSNDLITSTLVWTLPNLSFPQKHYTKRQHQ